MSALLNHTATRDFILQMAAKHRPGWKFARVSKCSLEYLEARMRNLIVEEVRRLPSTIHTVKLGE